VNSQSRVVVVGAGHAGSEVVSALRQGGFAGRITLLGDEASLPYARPPLSKAYLSGTISGDDLLLRAPKVYAGHDITVRTGIAVESIQRAERTVKLADGEAVPYDSLVLATGGRPRRLPHPELRDVDNVFYLRTITDVDALRPRFTPGARLVIIGGGYIGLEVAAVARKNGLDVTVLEAAERVLARVTAPAMSTFFERIHAEEGVRVRTSVHAQGFSIDNGDVDGVVLGGGEVVPADAVLVGIGLIPNTALAEAAGLTVDDGIVVDELLRTSDSQIYAIGDVARYPCSEHDGLRRLESVPNAAEQARVVAQALLGHDRPYRSVPWFWSDQFDVKLQVVGLSAGHDTIVVRGNPLEGRSISVFYLKNGQLRAAEVVSNPKEFVAAKKLVTSRVEVAPDLLADPTVALKDLQPAPRPS
jgi:3-phenylpropionate/trans-cinnamate dioxygenase ferredoxin reductase component